MRKRVLISAMLACGDHRDECVCAGDPEIARRVGIGDPLEKFPP